MVELQAQELSTYVGSERNIGNLVLWPITHSGAPRVGITLNTGCDFIDYPESNINGI